MQLVFKHNEPYCCWILASKNVSLWTNCGLSPSICRPSHLWLSRRVIWKEYIIDVYCSAIVHASPTHCEAVGVSSKYWQNSLMWWIQIPWAELIHKTKPPVYWIVKYTCVFAHAGKFLHPIGLWQYERLYLQRFVHIVYIYFSAVWHPVLYIVK